MLLKALPLHIRKVAWIRRVHTLQYTKFCLSLYSQTRSKKNRLLWEQASKECLYCKQAMNMEMPTYGDDKPRQHCGSDKCRKAASRANIAERKRQARTDARQRVLSYCEAQLDQEQKGAVMEMCDALMEYSYDEGHQIAEHIVAVVEAKRCKYDRIAELERNAAVWQRRAQASERQLKERIQELEAELEMFNNLSNTIVILHHIVAKLSTIYFTSRAARYASQREIESKRRTFHYLDCLVRGIHAKASPPSPIS